MNFIESLYGRPNTLKTQKSLFNKWIGPEVADPKNMDKQQFSALVTRWRVGKNLSPNTVRSLISLTSRYIEWSGGPRIELRALRKIVKQSDQQKKIKALSKEQTRILLDSITDKKLYQSCMIAYHTGMRKGEVFGLSWGDVDFITGMVYIQRSYDGPTKNGMSRYVPISQELEELLLKMCPSESKYSDRKKVIAPVFEPNPNLKRFCRASSVPEITFHAFRHTFATLALEAGRSPKLVSETLGHSNLSTTLDLYWSSIEGAIELGFC